MCSLSALLSAFFNPSRLKKKTFGNNLQDVCNFVTHVTYRIARFPSFLKRLSIENFEIPQNCRGVTAKLLNGETSAPQNLLKKSLHDKVKKI